MKLHVHVHGLQFVVPCGEGAQTFKWLGLVAAQRYALAAPHGRIRTREDAHLKQGFFLPASVTKANGQILAPQKRISEGCKDNETVTVLLQQEVPVNEIGTPQFPAWTNGAFLSQRSVSDNNRPIATKLPLATDTKAAAEPALSTRSRAAQAKTDGKDSSNPLTSTMEEDMKEYARCEMLQQVNSGQFQSEMELEAAFLYDWSRLRMEDFETDQRERERIQDLLLHNFHLINAAYMHYAVGSGELAYGMNAHEFGHFLHECGFYNFQRDHNSIEKAFSQTLRTDTFVSIHERGTLSRVGFLHALIRIIITSSTRDGQNNGVLRDLIEKALKERVLSTVLRLTSGPFRDHTHHDKTIAIFQEAKQKLLKLYNRYAGAHQTGSSSLPATAFSATWPLLLSSTGLKSMLYDSGIFCSGDLQQHEEIFDKALSQSFSGMAEMKSVDEQAVVFAEFIEVVARVALTVLKDQDLPPKDAIKIAIDALRSLPAKTTTTSSNSYTNSRRK